MKPLYYKQVADVFFKPISAQPNNYFALIVNAFGGYVSSEQKNLSPRRNVLMCYFDIANKVTNIESLQKEVNKLYLNGIQNQPIYWDKDWVLELSLLLELAEKSSIETPNPIYRPKPLDKLAKTALNYWAYAIEDEEKYSSFEIPKRSGGVRTISAPHPKLKRIQSAINKLVSEVYVPLKPVNGFVVGKSVVDNAKAHVGKRYVFNIDLKDFFPSITFRRVKNIFMGQPFNLNGEREHLAFLLANLCCANGSLPQGAPTSPVLSNLAARGLDHALMKLAKQHQCVYTRYADDITFSCYRNVFDEPFRQVVNNIVVEHKFEVNEKKVRLNGRHKKQEVTGLVVNQKVNVERKFIKDIRFWLHLWEKFGREVAKAEFETRSIVANRYTHRRKKNGETDVPDFSIVLQGKITFLGMVRGKEDEMYLRFKKHFDRLQGNLVEGAKSSTFTKGVTEKVNALEIFDNKPLELQPQSFDNLNLNDEEKEQILDLWENEGFEAVVAYLNAKNGQKSPD